MNIVQRIGSYFYPAPRRDGAAENQEGRRSVCHQFTRIAGGIGQASSAVLAWTFVAAGALKNSAYQGGRFILNRITLRNRNAVGAGAMDHEDEAIERIEPIIAPIERGHEAHGHRQEADQDAQAALRRQEAFAAPVAPVVVPRHEEPVVQMRLNEESMLSKLWDMGKTKIIDSAEMHPLNKVYKMSALVFAIFLKKISNLFTGEDLADMHSQLPSSIQYFLGKCFGVVIALISLVALPYYIYRLIK